MLNCLTLEAEAWAEAGTDKLEQYPLLAGRVPERLLRRYPPIEEESPGVQTPAAQGQIAAA